MKILSGLLFIVGCFLLYYGATMLLLVPGYPGETYFSSGRIRYGFVPFLLSLGCLAAAGRLWISGGVGTSNRRMSMAWAILLAAMAVMACYGVLLLIAGRQT